MQIILAAVGKGGGRRVTRFAKKYSVENGQSEGRREEKTENFKNFMD